MNPTAGPIDPERLIKLLTEQRDLYLQLGDLAQRQRNLISGDRPEMLLNILRDRQNLVMALASLNQELSPYRRDWESVYRRLPALAGEEASKLIAEINGTLQTILRTDQEDGALLSAKKSAVGRQLDELSGTRAANAAYSRRNGPTRDGSADLTV